MEDVKKFECIFCGQEVPISLWTIHDQAKDKSAILKLWNNECAKTICETLLGGEYISVFLQYFQNYNFCANCDQTVRDIQYFIYQIEAFKKRIHTLTQLIRSRLFESSKGISISKNTEKMKQSKILETRISTLIAEGPNGLKLYTHQEISEIMYKMASDKCSKDTDADKSHLIHSNTEMLDWKSKVLTSENYEETELEFKTEPEENLIDDYNNMEDNDYINEAMSEHNSYSTEEEINPHFEKAELSNTKHLRSSTTNKKVKQLQSDWKDDDTNSGSEDNEDPLSGAGVTYGDESDFNLNDHSKKPSNKRSGKKSEEELPALEKEREQRRRLNQIRANQRRREKRIAARLAKLAEDPVQKIVIMLNPEPTEEERLAIHKMTPEERHRFYQMRYNKKRRDMRLAEKIVKGCVCRVDNCGMVFPGKSEADDHYRENHEGIKAEDNGDTNIGSEDNGDTNIDSEDNGDTNIGSEDNGDANMGLEDNGDTNIGLEDNGDLNIDSVDNQDNLTGTGSTSWDESVLKLIDHSKKHNSEIRLKYKKRARKSKYGLSQIRYNQKKREKRLAKLCEDPVKKIVVMLNPGPTEEERKALQKMTPEERRRVYKLRFNKKRRDIRLAEKMLNSNNFVCPAENCNKTFTRKNEVDGHYREIHEGCTVDAYHCGDCPQKFSEYKLLYAHNKEREMCGTCIGKDECKFCGRRYTTEAELNVHISEAHSGPNPFDCAFCEMEFTNSVELRKHTEELHMDVAKLICEECGKVYPANKIKTFRVHVAHHRLLQAERIHNCEKCSKSFQSVGLLKQHQNYVHDKKEKFMCEICSKEYVGRYAFVQHQKRTHERPYKCKICDKTFARSSRLRDHEISHTGIRNFFVSLVEKRS